MLLYHLKNACRGYLRNTKFTFLNLMSLVTGLFVAYVGISYINFEKNYESFHENSDNIYRLARTYRSQDYSIVGFPNWSDSNAEEQKQQAETLRNSLGIEEVTQFIISANSEFIRHGEIQNSSDGILTTNTPSGFVSIFTWKPILGSLDNFSKGKNKALLTRSVAEKLFGPESLNNPDLINKQLQIGSIEYEIAAIIQDVPVNSHFNFNIALSNDKIDFWGSRIYLSTLDNSNIQEIEKQINSTLATINPRLQNDQLYAGHFLQPIQTIHLNSKILYESKAPGNTAYITLIGFFALFILVLTLFNYTNLTLAIKSKESKSIGVRKAMGAQNVVIIFQFILEGVLLSIIALPIVGILISNFLPSFNKLMDDPF